MRFPISFELLNLLRNPDIDIDRHSFREEYKAKLRRAAAGFTKVSLEEKADVPLPKGTHCLHLVVYVHLALAHSSNLDNLCTLLSQPGPGPVSKDINSTNVVNVWSLVDTIRAVPTEKLME